MQTLEVFQSLWGMQLRDPEEIDRPHEDSFSCVAQAGYAGMCLDPSVSEIDDFLKTKPLFEQHGLRCLVNVFPASVNDMRPLLEFTKEMGAPFANVIGQVYPLTPEEAEPIVRAWMEIADDVGIPILMETHRDCITNDMFFTLNLMDLIPEMRLCADLSHYVVNREMRVPVSEPDQAHITKILDRSDCFQGRVANREQIQLPVTFPQHQKWVNEFKIWWEQGMRSWRARSDPDDILIFLCELGPPEYAITGADGKELSNREEDALIIRHWAEEIWAKLEAESA